MREELQSTLKSRFRSALIRVRNTKRIPQEEMAALLEISPRAYADLESGRSCCSAATLLMFLRLFCPGDHPLSGGAVRGRRRGGRRPGRAALARLAHRRSAALCAEGPLFRSNFP